MTQDPSASNRQASHDIDKYVQSLDAFDPLHSADPPAWPPPIIKYPHVSHLRPSIGRYLLLLFGAFLFTAGGWWMVANGNALGWLPLLFFGAAVPVALIQCLPGASGAVVMKEGFAIRSLFRTRFFAWHEVSAFGILTVKSRGPTQRYVSFNAPGRANRLSAKLSRAVSGFSDCLPETYGYPPEQLAEALNAYRQQALTSQNIPMAQ